MPIIAAIVAGILVWLVLGKSEGQANYSGGCARVFLWCVVLAIVLAAFAAAVATHQ